MYNLYINVCIINDLSVQRIVGKADDIEKFTARTTTHRFVYQDICVIEVTCRIQKKRAKELVAILSITIWTPEVTMML